MREYYTQLYENLGEMDNFLVTVNYQNQSKRKMENLTKPVAITETRR